MKFIVSSTVLMAHLKAIGRKIDTKKFHPKLDEFVSNCGGHKFIKVGDNYKFPAGTPVLQTALLVKALRKGSLKELLRRMAMYMQQIVSTQFALSRKTKFESLTLFFGLCCSSPTYIFNAIFGNSYYPVPSFL